MFRLRLAAVILVSLGFVLLLGGAMYWGSDRMARIFQTSQAAYDRFDDYQHLSLEAYRHFEQRLDHLLTESPESQAGVQSSRQRLYQAIEKLRNNAVRQPGNPNDGGKSAELERVARFTAFLDASAYRFDEIETLRRLGKRDQAVAALVKYSAEDIDGTFQPLIDAAINGEREKAGRAKAELEQLVTETRRTAWLAASAAALLSLISGILLFRSVRQPIEALMKGAREIADGHLDYRISAGQKGEFGRLATDFNGMAEKLAEQQDGLRAARTALESRVAERTAELHALNEKLVRMDNERREFLADISHELRTPITVLCGEAEVTLRGTERQAEEYKEALQRIFELAMQLGKYVNDLLYIARTETADLPVARDRVDLTELIAAVAEDIQVIAQESALSVALDLPAEPTPVRGDKQRLRQVLFILGDNACRYSRPGGCIGIALWTDGREACFSLSDQGIGIPEQDLQRIFDRRFRSENARNSCAAGTGLGLPLARSILKAHGGQIAVSSRENAGSTFTVTLPLAAEQEQPADELPS